MVLASVLLQHLPTFKNHYVLISDDQEVNDIIVEVLDAHEAFANDYDKIADFFLCDTLEDTCRELFDFLKKNVRYVIETEDHQTTKSPGAIIISGKGDCKHYAGFIAGVLDALKRQGCKIVWTYRFASYKWWNSDVQHVFVVAKANGKEFWIDPVLTTFNKRNPSPSYTIDKKVNTMLSRVSGFENTVNGYPQGYAAHIGQPYIGTASINVSAIRNIDNLNYDGTHKFAGVFGDYLGLSDYNDYSGDRIISNLPELTQAINQEIKNSGGSHTVTPDFVKWVYDNSIRSWNFLQPAGVMPGFSAENLLPAGYPRLVFSEDGRLILNPMIAIDDYHNPEIHLLTAWAQDLINQYDSSPYPIKPKALKEFSQGKEGGTNTLNILTEQRGDSIFKEIGKALEDAVNFVKDGVLKIAGSIPRNAYLSLVGLNIFHWADHLQEKINSGHWPEMANTWKKVGGNPDKLKNTIEHGSKVPATDDKGNTISAAPAAAAWLAAAAPIIAIMFKYLDKSGKAGEIVGATIPLLQQQFPGIDFSPLASGLTPIDRATGKEIEWYVDPKDDENKGGGNDDLPGKTDLKKFIIPGVAALGTYFLMNKPGRKPNYLIPLGVGIAAYFLWPEIQSLFHKGTTQSLSTADKRRKLLEWNASNGGDSQETIDRVEQLFAQQMSDSEINTVYDYVFNYALKNIPVPQPSTLYTAIMQISDKYQIFT